MIKGAIINIIINLFYILKVRSFTDMDIFIMLFIDLFIDICLKEMGVL